MCSIQRPPHTSLLVKRRQSDEANGMGIIRRPWWSENNGRTNPYSFSKVILGFLMTTGSQDLGLMSHPKDGACWQNSVAITGALGPTQTTGWAPLLASLTPLPVFPGGLPSSYWPAQPCLASVGNRSWAAGHMKPRLKLTSLHLFNLQSYVVHLADTFIQNDVQCIQAIHFLSVQ